MVDLVMVPWGYATFKTDTEAGAHDFKCQHGENECTAQMLQACVRFASDYKAGKYVPFFIALETEMMRSECMNEKCCDPTEMAAKLATESFPAIDWHRAMVCNRRKSMRISAALSEWEKTNMLAPKPNFIPWITLNDAHSDAIQKQCFNDLVGCVCQVYQGSSAACSSTRVTQ